MFQPQSESEQLVRMLPAGAQVNRRPFVADTEEHALTAISNAGLVDVQHQLARLRTSDE